MRFDEQLGKWVFDLNGKTYVLPSQWSGPVCMENIITGDGRFIESGALEWNLEEATPMRATLTDTGAHNGAVAVGMFESIERRDGGVILASGRFDLGSEVGRESARLVATGFKRGVSVDLGNVTFEFRVARDVLQTQIDDVREWEEEMEKRTDEDEEPEDLAMWEQMQAELDSMEEDENGYVTIYGPIAPDDEIMVTIDAMIRAATLVDIPAFSGAYISVELEEVGGETEDEEEEGGESLAASGFTLYDVTDEGVADVGWDRASEYETLLAMIPEEDFHLGFAACESVTDGEGESVTNYMMLHHHVVDGEVGAANLTACRDGIAELASSDDIPIEIKFGIYDHLTTHIVEFGDEAEDNPYTSTGETGEEMQEVDGDEASTDEPVCTDCNSFSLVASGAGVSMKNVVFFDNPNLPTQTPLTITREGRVFGHLATWETCHIGIQDACITPPHSIADYAYFHTGVVEMDDVKVPVGQITLGGGHADPRSNHAEAVRHYDEAGTVVADIVCGEDEYGIWFSGQLRSNITDEQREALAASSLSGDWRNIAGNLELIATLAVNVPGFPIPRPRAHMVAAGHQQSLVASGIVEQITDHERTTRTASEVAQGVTMDTINRVRKGDKLREKLAAFSKQSLAERYVKVQDRISS